MDNKKIKVFIKKQYAKAPICIKRCIMRFAHAIMRFKKMHIEIHLSEHCNLNCKGCDNFSCIATEQYTDKETFRKDLIQLHRIFGNKHIQSIRLLGGEPTLNPDISYYLKLCREIFKSIPIQVISNGLLLCNMSSEFYDTCKTNSIEIMLTKYPIEFDYEGTKKIINDKGIKCDFFNNETIKTMYKKPLDIEGRQNPSKMFDLCFNANRCITLKDGYLYTCSLIPNIVHFNKYFNQNLLVDEQDRISIYKNTNARKIKKYLSRSVPFCRYCKVCEIQWEIPWSITKKDINEWC